MSRPDRWNADDHVFVRVTLGLRLSGRWAHTGLLFKVFLDRRGGAVEVV